MNDKTNPLGVNFLVTPGLRIMMVFLSWIVGSILMLFVSMLLGRMLDNNYLAYLRISTVFQDILMWIVPALVTAVVITRNPARMLAVDTLPTLRQVVLAVLLLVVSTPFMSWIIRLNADVHLPESLAPLEQWLRTMEQSAQGVVDAMFDSVSPAAVILNVLIIGVLAGFSEELFFRGALQRILVSSKMSVHAAIWITAFIFSAMHFQFFGFVPRMLLGAGFGYLLWWSGSVWLPMLVHTLNNSVYVVLYSFTGSGEPEIAGGTSWGAILLSVVLTALTVVALARTRRA